MSLPDCDQLVAQVACVCTTPPISGKFLYKTICVGVSDEGFKSPSTTFPSRSTTTISSFFKRSYGTPLGLITTKFCSLQIPLTLPHVKVTKLCFGNATFVY